MTLLHKSESSSLPGGEEGAEIIPSATRPELASASTPAEQSTAEVSSASFAGERTAPAKNSPPRAPAGADAAIAK